MIYFDFLRDYMWGNNTAYDYLLALAIFISLLFVLKIFQVVILARLNQLAKKTVTDFDDTIISIFKSIKPPFYFFIALYFAIKFLTLPLSFLGFIKVLVWLVLVYEIISAVDKIIRYIVIKYFTTKNNNEDIGQARSIARTLQILAKVILWLIGLILILSNLGVNVNSLIASLGIGGLAVALALQNILSDLFSSFSIYIDKPFEVGDFIVIGNDMGTVQKIGLKTTRIRTLQGEELVIANKELTTTRVQNFKRMTRRRVVVNLGVVYDTPADKLQVIPEIIKELVKAIDKVEFDRCHFAKFNNSSLDFELVYYIDSSDYNVYMDLQQQVNLEIYQAFNKEKIEFAYPTQTLFVKK